MWDEEFLSGSDAEHPTGAVTGVVGLRDVAPLSSVAVCTVLGPREGGKSVRKCAGLFRVVAPWHWWNHM